MSGRQVVYGEVYELDLEDSPPNECDYVGKVTRPTTIHQRVWGKSASAHTSPESIAKDPWKARIKKDRRGYRSLEVVYATGDRVADQAALRRAEAAWIDRLRPIYNEVRPVRPFGYVPPKRTARQVAARPVAPAARRPGARREPITGRMVAFLLLAALFTGLAARSVLAMDLESSAAPWLAAPAVGVPVAWLVLRRLHRSYRWLRGGR